MISGPPTALAHSRGKGLGSCGHQRRSRVALLTAVLASAFVLLSAGGESTAFADFGIASFDGEVVDENGDPFTQAGGHPFAASTSIHFNQTTDHQGNPVPDESVREISVDLPAGLVGNPQAVPTHCTEAQLTAGNILGIGECPLSSQVGVAEVVLGGDWFGFGTPTTTLPVPVFAMVPPDDVPAQFGFRVLTTDVHINARVRSASDYGLTAELRNVSNALPIVGTTLTLWGVPADPDHDSERADCLLPFTPQPCSYSIDMPLRPFLTNPTACTPPGVGLETKLYVESWNGSTAEASFFSHLPPGPPTPGPQQGPTGCANVPFAPNILVEPTSHAADSPTGLEVDLHVPQADNPDGVESAHLKKVVVTLPEGMAVNPGASDGLDACSQAQIDLASAADPTCPNAAKVGTVEVETPLLAEPMSGSIYLAQQGANPFNSLLAIYIVAKGPGVILKLPGRIEPDQQTGRLTATFDDNPQLPFERFRLRFFGGPRAPLSTPPTCGTFETTTEMSPWSAADPDVPTPDEIATPSDTFTIDSGPNGGPCVSELADRPFVPGFSAGTVHPLAGFSSPFVMRATRADGQQEIKRLAADLPPGLVARLRGVPYCGEGALASIPTAPGTAQAEADNPSCPTTTQVGVANIGAGAGAQPFYIPGRVYLAGPYQGAPLSLAIVTPALAGPFDLGNEVVRARLIIDPDDAQVHVISDEIPHILEGIPLRIRDIRVNMNRPGFMQAPTSCDPMAVTGRLTGAGGDPADPADDVIANVSDRFQVGGCGGLGFKPRFFARALGNKRFAGHPTFRTILTAPAANANIKRVHFKFPRSLTIDQRFTTGLCTETQLVESECEGARIYGRAVANTPLLDQPLRGPVYLVSGSGGLPRLAMILRGPPSQPITLVIRGNPVGTRDGGYRVDIPLVPDASVTRFVLTMFGSRQSIIQNTRNLCRAKAKGRVTMIAHNNKRFSRKVGLGAKGCRKARRRAAQRRQCRRIQAKAKRQRCLRRVNRQTRDVTSRIQGS